MKLNQDVLKALSAFGIETNVPTVGLEKNLMTSTGTGVGDEVTPGSTMNNALIDAIPTYGTFLPQLPGNQNTALGRMMMPIEEVPIVGDVGLFKLGSEKSSGAFAMAAGNSDLATGSITITQKKLEMTVDVTEELKTFNILGAEEFERRLKEKVAKAAARTVEHVILNGDNDATNTNINYEGGAAPAATEAYLGFNNGLRDIALSTAINIGSPSLTGLRSMENLLGDYFAAPENCLWLYNRSTYNSFTGLQQFYDAAQRGESSTVAGNAITSIDGADVFICRDLVKAQSTGKVSSNPANNTLGQLLLVWKPAVQYGFGSEINMMIMNWGKDGYQLQCWFFFGFTIVSAKAGVTDASVAMGRNVTL